MCEINDSGGGKHASAFRRAAERFCEQHPGERFIISCGGVGQEGLQITIQRKGDRYALRPRSVPIAPDMEMEDHILVNLEDWWSSQSA